MVVVASADLSGDIALLEAAGYRLDMIFPADAPRVAEVSGHGVSFRLDSSAVGDGPTLSIPGLDREVPTSSNSAEQLDVGTPEFDDAYVYTHGGNWAVGRAGMEYRDLLPDRHGGTVIASHIRISEPGPVPDYVHHHDIRFQMIYCRRGRVQVVYEDQGDAFWMEAGDCVLQPPNIRHRVLASEDGCEVVEIASPAEHPTFIEHGLDLPTATVDPDRDFLGQKFCFDRSSETPWKAIHQSWEAQITGIGDATNGLASVQVLRPISGGMRDELTGTSGGDLCLFFVLAGNANLFSGSTCVTVQVDSSTAVPAGHRWTIEEASTDFECLHVVLHRGNR